MCYLSWLNIALLASSIICASCQRRAERETGIFYEDDYDDYWTEDYDVVEDSTIFRWNVDEFPQPRQSPKSCNRPGPSNICDPDKVLQEEQANVLDAKISRLYKDTRCICKRCGPKNDGGIVIGIALLKHMFQPYNQNPSKTIRSFTENLREQWKLGQCHNDILIVVATEDRLSYTDVGRSTSGYISVHEAHQIFLENKAHFSDNRFYEGLVAMLDSYNHSTASIASMRVMDDVGAGTIAGIIVGALLVAGLLVFGIVAYLHYRTKKSGKNGSSDNRAEGVSSTWKRKDIKVMFSSLVTTDKARVTSKYQQCDTEEKTSDPTSQTTPQDEEEVIDTTLQIYEDDSKANDTQMTMADESQIYSIDEPDMQGKREYTGHVTDL